MVKKLINLVSAVLALNFLFAAGGVGYLVFAGKLDKEKVQEIRKLIIDEPAAATTQPATQPAQETSPLAPILRLDEVLAKAAGRPAGEKLELVQNTYDAKGAILERRLRELEDQKRQLEQAKADYDAQRQKMLVEAEALKKLQEEQVRLANDKGFQDTLALYQAMPPKRTKDIFKTLPDETVVRYLQAMEPRQAGGILKEFKTPEETSRAQVILEKMRQANAKAE